MKLNRSLAYALLIFVFVLSLSSWTRSQDKWTQVRSKNFYLIGNASEKDIRKVGTKLEQFRESFRLLFSSANLNASIPTNVVVFKSDSAYKPFKPKRDDGKSDNWIAGYFQPGDDVNYITLSTAGEDAETFGTIFHEYVHFIINTNFGRSDVPQWFNEGLAEYYQTFEIADGIKLKLGLPQSGHLALLQQSQLMPLEQLFKITNYQLHQTGGHSRSIFYAQSWALVHYLTQGGKSAALGAYLTAVTRGTDHKTAFETAFQTTHAKMEKELRDYVYKRSFNYNEATLKKKLDFDSLMEASPLSEADANAYLGDLLYHTNRPDDAEPYLLKALAAQPDSSMANTSLGMVRIKQRKFDEARNYLEKAIAGDPKNHVAYYQYAVLLSREGRDEFGFVKQFEPATATKMRDSLKKAIALNPTFTESYEMLAFVSLVNNDQLDEAAANISTALKYNPGSQRYLIRLAELYSRQKKFDAAKQIAEKLVENADDDSMRSRASGVLGEIRQYQDFERQREAEQKRYAAATSAAGDGKPRLMKRNDTIAPPSEEQMARMQKEARMRGLNEAVRVPAPEETRVIGRIEKIDCKKRPITYSVKAGAETFILTSHDFSGLYLSSLDEASANATVGCDANIAAFNALVTFKPTPKGPGKGEAIAVEFVPADFRIMTEEEMRAAETMVVYDVPNQPKAQNTEAPPPLPTSAPNQQDMEARRREMMLQAMRDNLRKPGAEEKREFGFLDKVECTDKAQYFYFRTATQTIKLLSSPTQQPNIMVYTPDLSGVRFGCGLKAIEFPAVFIYGGKPDKKAKTDGNIVSIEFMPKSFVLEQQ
ncbi:MAG: tetratricopeptide repeat protein [Pyrinomonadaceae bacterium]